MDENIHRLAKTAIMQASQCNGMSAGNGILQDRGMMYRDMEYVASGIEGSRARGKIMRPTYMHAKGMGESCIIGLFAENDGEQAANRYLFSFNTTILCGGKRFLAILLRFAIYQNSTMEHRRYKVNLRTLVASEAKTRATTDLLELQHIVEPGH